MNPNTPKPLRRNAAAAPSSESAVPVFGSCCAGVVGPSGVTGTSGVVGTSRISGVAGSTGSAEIIAYLLTFTHGASGYVGSLGFTGSSPGG